MKRYEPSEDERVVIVEQRRSSDIGVLVLGLMVGAGLGLLLAPQTGAETRQVLRRRLRSARHVAEEAAGDVAERLTGSFAEAREEIERRIEAARAAVSRRTNQLADAVAAGRSAVRRADSEMRAQLVDAAPPRGFSHRPARTPSTHRRSQASRQRGAAGSRSRPAPGAGAAGVPPKRAGAPPERTEE